jgi:NADPH-dependent 2,4-dienoyl-CoA reductase/sulfur reductase-like enzyme
VAALLVGAAIVARVCPIRAQPYGIDVVRGDEVRGFRGHSPLDTVELHSANPIGASLAVVGIGVAPAVGFLNGSGITVANGVVVNERFQTNVPGIYAVGDVACFFDPLTGRQQRIEHWSNASYQGGQVGKILAGAEGGYNRIATFFTESFGLTLKMFGDTSHHDDRIARGSFADGNAIVFYFADGRLVASLHSGQDDETETQLKQLIGNRATPRGMRALADESLSVSDAFLASTTAGVKG